MSPDCVVPVSPAVPPEAAFVSTLPPLLWGADGLHQAGPGGVSWVWHGFLARGAVTLFTSQWKAGKTTLLAVLLARLKTGGLFAGLPLAAGRALIISEESQDLWDLRSRKLDFSDHVGWYCRPFRGLKPSPAAWVALLDHLADLHAQRGLSLVAIDTLASFLPAAGENNAAAMVAALGPLQRLASRGLSVLVTHHPRKGRTIPGQAARGSGALSGFADILIEMRHYRRAADDDRRRKLLAFSRYDATPRQLVIELAADGADYLAHGSFQEEEFAGYWPSLRALLAAAPRKLSRVDIRKRWPGDRRPDHITLLRLLEPAVATAQVCRDGRGTRNHPFRYWLPEREAHWRADPLAVFTMPDLFHQIPEIEN